MKDADDTTFTPASRMRTKLVDVDPHRVVDHGVGLQREQRVDVIGGLDAQWLDACQFAGVAAGLSFDHA